MSKMQREKDKSKDPSTSFPNLPQFPPNIDFKCLEDHLHDISSLFNNQHINCAFYYELDQAGQEVHVPTGNFLWDMDIYDFVLCILTEEKALNFLIHYGFVAVPSVCPRANCNSTKFATQRRKRRFAKRSCKKGPEFSKVSNHQYIRCKKCQYKTPLRKDSWLEHFPTCSYRGLALMLYFYCQGINAFLVVKRLAKYKVTKDIVYRFYTFCRYLIQVYSYYKPIVFVPEDLEIPQGEVLVGFGRETAAELLKAAKDIRKWINIEQDQEECYTENYIRVTGHLGADESVLGMVKDHKVGTDTETVWTWAVCTEKGGKGVAYLIPNRKAKTLLDLIGFHVHKDCILHTDCLASYNKIKELLEIEHYTVNHTYCLKSPEGIDTNCIEGFWGLLKVHLAYSRGVSSLESLRQHIDEFCFIRNYKEENGTVARKMIELFSYPYYLAKASEFMTTFESSTTEERPSTSKKTYNYSASYLRDTIRRLGAHNVETAIYANVISKDKLDVDAIYSPQTAEIIKSIAKTLEISSDTIAFITTFLPCALFGNNVEVYAVRSEPIVLNELAFLINSTSLGKSTALNICLKSPCAFVKKFGYDCILIDECTPHKIDNLLNETNGRATFAVDDLTSKFVASFENRLDNHKLRTTMDEIFTGDARNTINSYSTQESSERIRVLLMGLGHPGMQLQVLSHFGMSTEAVGNKVISLTASYEAESGPYTKIPAEVNVKFILELTALGLAIGHDNNLIEYHFSDEAKQFLIQMDKENKENLQLFWKLNELISKGLFEKEDIPKKALDAHYNPRLLDMLLRLAFHLFIVDQYFIRAFAEGSLFNPEPLNKIKIGVEYVKKAMAFFNTTALQRKEYGRMMKILATQNVPTDIKLQTVTLKSNEEALARKCLLIPGTIIAMSIMERVTKSSKTDIMAALSKWMKSPASRDFIGTLETGTYPNRHSSIYLAKCPDHHIDSNVLVKLGISALEYRQSFFATDDELRKIHKIPNHSFEDIMNRYVKQLPNWFPNDELWQKYYAAAKRSRFMDLSDLIDIYPPLKEEVDQTNSASMLEYMVRKIPNKRKIDLNQTQLQELKDRKIRFLDLCHDGVLLYQTKLQECEELNFANKGITMNNKRRNEISYRIRQVEKAEEAQKILYDLRKNLSAEPYNSQALCTHQPAESLTLSANQSMPTETNSQYEVSTTTNVTIDTSEDSNKRRSNQRVDVNDSASTSSSNTKTVPVCRKGVIPTLQFGTGVIYTPETQYSLIPQTRKIRRTENGQKETKYGSEDDESLTEF